MSIKGLFQRKTGIKSKAYFYPKRFIYWVPNNDLMKKLFIFAIILSAFILAILLGILSLDYNSSYSETYGKVVDENGVGIPNLNVTFFYVREGAIFEKTFSPVLVKRINSNENGEFYADSLDIENNLLYFRHYKRVTIFRDAPSCDGKLICSEDRFTFTKDFSSKKKEITISLNRDLFDRTNCHCDPQEI